MRNGPAEGRTTVLYRIASLMFIVLGVLLGYIDMENDCAMDNGGVIPAWEVVLRVEGHDVAVAAAVEGKTKRFDIVVGVDDVTSLLKYADIVREASFRIATAQGFVLLVDRDDREAAST